ncbi:MAG: SAM-dependent methyltransferase [Anaerolineae bacterium]|nr:MAG: SAM-dependent methyltransferase [Anaerolineae bacterium]WKZ45428.1 MAG: class I SAM-dependent methyltransferase [Anaerolineales bacterium]
MDSRLSLALAARQSDLDSNHESAFRLFNGFSEGDSNLSLDVYGRTLLINNYADDPTQLQSLIDETIGYLRSNLNWLRAGILKTRNGTAQEDKRGKLLFGDSPDAKVKEHGVWYALDLTMNRDASFYLDTSNLRKWLIENMRGKSVLNTFAYTGSFGVAALAGGATRVVQVDRNRRFLDLAKQSYALNGFEVDPKDFVAQDFFPAVSRFKHAKQLFDCVILDPPFFSSTSRGRVDQVNESARLINKVRPLVNDGGTLIAINNALFVSGQEFLHTLEKLCEDGCMKIQELIPVPQSFVGYNIVNKPITDPTPFNHSTKIAILKIKRKL